VKGSCFVAIDVASFAAGVHSQTSYLEWFKYKTAKLLLYTVYRIRHQKQLGRK